MTVNKTPSHFSNLQPNLTHSPSLSTDVLGKHLGEEKKKNLLLNIRRICILVCCCLVTQSCPNLCDPVDCSPSRSSVHGDSPGKNTGVSYHALLQGIFPTQGSNPGLLHCRWILYHLNHQGSPRILECVACLFSRGSSQPKNRTCIAGGLF